MAQAIRQTTFVQSDGTITIKTPQFPQGAKVEVIIIKKGWELENSVSSDLR